MFGQTIFWEHFKVFNHRREDAIVINMPMKMGHHETKYYHVNVGIVWPFIMPFDLGGMNQNSKYMNAQ